MLLFGGIFFRLSVLHLRPAEWIYAPIEAFRSYELKRMGTRGPIVDRNGEILAVDLIAHHVVLDPKYIAAHGDADLVCRTLAAEFKSSEEELRGYLKDEKRQYVRFRQFVPGHQLQRFERRDFGVVYRPSTVAGGAAEGVRLRGVILEEVPLRRYPKGALMAHVVGFANREGAGAAGVELQMDKYLRGKEGHRISKKDGRRREVYSARQRDIPPENGATVVLTLDQHLQHVVEQTIEKTCNQYRAKAAWAIMQHIPTGEILAMASFPSYDLNRYGKAPAEWMRNRTIGFNYEPGSTMKAGVIAAAIDEGAVTTADRFDCENGVWTYGGKALHDSHGEGVLAVPDIIKVSSNIGTAKIALELGSRKLYERLRLFQFGSRLGVGLPGEEAGIFYSPENWSKISITRIGIGHEIGVTSLQVLSMMSAIAYNGVQMSPLLVKRVIAPDGTVLQENRPKVLGRPISPATARKMCRMLARVVAEEDGTGRKARVEGYAVAGKTGTAQKIRPSKEGGGYYAKKFISSFVGFLPVDNPQIGIVVVADDPGVMTESGWKIKYSGGAVCAPAFKEIAEFAVRYLRIAPEGERVYLTRRVE